MMSYKHKHYNELTEKKQEHFKEWWNISQLEEQDGKIHLTFNDEDVYAFVCKDYDSVEELKNNELAMNLDDFDIMVYVWGSSLISWR